MARIALGQYIVVDDEICHGQATFKGTRIMVWQVLRMLSHGITWDQIVSDWSGRVPKEAIAEAVCVGKDVLKEHTHDYAETHATAA